jgi:hypothetical protein
VAVEASEALSFTDLTTPVLPLYQALDLDPAKVLAWLVALPQNHRGLSPQLSAMRVGFPSPDHASFLAVISTLQPARIGPDGLESVTAFVLGISTVHRITTRSRPGPVL